MNNFGGPHRHKKKKSEIICRCNSVRRDEIEDAIVNRGCRTLNEIFDETQAGVGACGGSCRRKLGPLLDAYIATGAFPEKIIEDMTGKFPVDPGAMPAPLPGEDDSSLGDDSSGDDSK